MNKYKEYNKKYNAEYRKKYPKGTPNTFDKVCLQCSTVFQVQKYRLSKAKFCTVKCGLIGNKHAGDGSKSTEREKWQGSNELKAWRKAVFQRDGYKCVECGATEKRLNADHIKPWAYFPKLRAVVANGRTLCVDCHKQTSTYGSRAKVLATQGAL